MLVYKVYLKESRCSVPTEYYTTNEYVATTMYKWYRALVKATFRVMKEDHPDNCKDFYFYEPDYECTCMKCQCGENTYWPEDPWLIHAEARLEIIDINIE